MLWGGGGMDGAMVNGLWLWGWNGDAVDGDDPMG